MKTNKKIENAWAMFDWANSAYSLVISTAIFPPYFIAMTEDFINVMGIEVSNSALYAFAITFSYAIIALSSPLLSGIADYSGKRMFFLKMFTTLGALSCMALFFFQGMSTIAIGFTAFVLATIGHAGSLVYYNAYLPEIVEEDRMDQLSAKGYAWGYIGSVILLVFNLLVITYPGWFGISDGTLPARIAFLTVGLWWIGFASITFRHMPKSEALGSSSKIITKGYHELLKVWKEIQPFRDTKRFLYSFFFYSAGVQTVIYLATAFAEKELNFETSELILIILILQIVAIGGAYLFAYISRLTSNKSSLLAMIIIWFLICVVAHYVTQKSEFYVLAGMVGLVLGGIQSLSRSSYSKLIPAKTKDMTSYFSFYDVMYKTSIIAGTFCFGLVDQLTGNMRYSILVLGGFFIVGYLIMRTVEIKRPESQIG